MNTRLLRKIAKHIADEPRRMDMDLLCDIVDPKFNDVAPPCGTVGCIAGWSCLLTGTRRHTSWNSTFMWDKGRKLLRLTKEQANRLFSTPSDAIVTHENRKEGFLDDDDLQVWPLKFARRYEKARTPKAKAAATVARIEHFIATKGRE